MLNSVGLVDQVTLFIIISFPGSGNVDSSLEPVHQPGGLFCRPVGGASPGLMEWPRRSQASPHPPQPRPGPAGSGLPSGDVSEAAGGLLPAGQTA